MSTPFSPCTTPSDTFKSLFLLQALYAYQTQSTPLNSVPQLLDGVLAVNANFPAGTAPAWILVDRGDELDVVIGGTASTGSFQAQIVSASGPLVAGGQWKTGAVQLSDAGIISRAITQTAPARSPRVTIVGHSYGGVLAEIAAAQLLDTRADLAVSVTTFGAPRPGDVGLAGRLQQLNPLRVMNDNDPIPHFPPKWFEAPTMVIAGGGVVSAFWSQWVQPNGGLVLRPDGSFYRSALPPLNAPIADLNLLAWLSGANGEMAQAHTINQYATRVGLASQALFAAGNSWPGQRSAEASMPITVADATVFVQSGGQVVPQSLLAGGPMAAYIPVQFRAKAKYSAPFFWVTWNGFVVSNHTTKSSARTHAKYINKWLRVMQTAKNVSQSNLIAALTAYLAAAPQSSLGFIPPLTVNP